MTVLVLSERLCECGCGASLQGRQKNTRYVDSSHRARACKDRAAKKRPTSPSGPQISFHKAVRVLAEYIAEIRCWPMEVEVLPVHVADAEHVLRQALPERQRARLR